MENPHSLIFSFLQLLLPFLSSAMEKGNPGPSSVAARVAARQRISPSSAPVVAEPAIRGRGRGEVADEVEDEVEALGEEADGTERQLHLRRRLLPPRRSI